MAEPVVPEGVPFPGGAPPGGFPTRPEEWRNRAFGRAEPPPGSLNGMALASFVFGLLGWSLLGLGSVVAVACGIAGLRQIRRGRGAQRGRALALAGIGLGAASIVAIMIAAVMGAIVHTH
jgi:hypothetical protein